jgi:hypothetical protein
MSRNIFISYKFGDAELVRTLRSWFQPHGECQGTPIFVDSAIPTGEPSEVTKKIDEKILKAMQDCVAAVFVVGDDNHNSPWINREAQIAIGLPLEILAMQAKDSTGGLPNELARLNREIDLLKWGASNLCPALNAIPQPKATS